MSQEERIASVMSSQSAMMARDIESDGFSRTHLRNGLAEQERAHRFRLRLGIAAVVILGVAPVFVHHSAMGDEVLLRGVSEVANSYLIAIHHLLGPVHTLFHLLLFTGFFYAIADRVAASLRVRHTVRALRGDPPRIGDAFWMAAAEAELSPASIRVVTSRMPNPAFTAGWFRPRVYVKSDLAAALSPSELAALLAHEAAHVTRRDPLRLSALRFLVRWLFWVPVLGRLADDVADEIEIAADDHAAERDPLTLASAILRVAQWPSADVRTLGVVGFFQHDILDRRVLRLAGEASTIQSRVTRRSWVIASFALVLVWLSGAIVAHPLPSTARHIAHSSPTAHLSTPDRIGLWVERVADGDIGHTHN